MNKDLNCNNIEIINQSIFEKRYNILDEIGTGHCSTVFKILDTLTKETKVAKIIEDNSISEFRKEVDILKKIGEYNIN